MKLNLGVIILVIVSIALSCKKEDKQPTTSATSGGGLSSGYPTSNATLFSGMFTTGRYMGKHVYQSMTYTFDINKAWAYFTATPQAVPVLSTATSANGVFLNGDSLLFDIPSFSFYSNSTSTMGISLASETWSVNGAFDIPTFTITNNFTTPSATGYLSFPDSISKASGFIVSVNNVSNSTTSNLLVTDNFGNFCIKALNEGSNTVTITPSDLSSLFTFTAGSISVELSNRKAFVISNKDYLFTRQFQYIKDLNIKP